MYRTIGGVHKFSDEDIYSKGCIPNSGISISFNMTFEGETPSEVVEKIMKFHSVEGNYDLVLLDSCEEAGRVDVEILETANGNKATDRDMLEWEKGDRRLWLSLYIHRIIQCEPISLQGEE